MTSPETEAAVRAAMNASEANEVARWNATDQRDAVPPLPLTYAEGSPEEEAREGTLGEEAESVGAATESAPTPWPKPPPDNPTEIQVINKQLGLAGHDYRRQSAQPPGRYY